MRGIPGRPFSPGALLPQGSGATVGPESIGYFLAVHSPPEPLPWGSWVKLGGDARAA